MSIPARADLISGSSKTYTHSVGLSAAFRQWRAQSHCRFIHGYALQVRCVFEAKELDHTNWVVDFGSMKSFKGWLEDMFDHKLLVARDDPSLAKLAELHHLGLADVRVVEATGCEAFARLIYEYLETWLVDNGYSPRVSLIKVEVNEHQGNSAYVALL